MKNFYSVLFMLFIFYNAFSLDVRKEYNSFLLLNNSLISSKQYLCNQTLIEFENETVIKEESTKCIYSNSSQIVEYKDRNQTVYFLSTNSGYFIYNKKLKKPIKVSGSYEFNDLEIQDLLRIDFENDYRIIEEKEESLVLQRKNSKLAYNYIEFYPKEDDLYEMIFCDKNKKQIKKINYQKSNINGINLFSELSIYSLVFETNKFRKYLIESVRETKIPTVLFNDSQISNLIKHFNE